MLELDPSEARRLAIGAQGLLESRAFGRGKPAALSAIEHLGYVQIDTISVVERAHHHVLWSRVPDYSPAHLHELTVDGKVFEYWSHAAAFLPMRDYRFRPRVSSTRARPGRGFLGSPPRSRSSSSSSRATS